MGYKYEVQYWDYIKGTNITVELTDSIFRAIYLLHKYEKQSYCVTIKFRRDKVRKNKKRGNKYE